jgi:GT2 family glycosyltransferase
MPNQSVSVIIVSLGAKDLIFSCLDSLLSQSAFLLEIILIDNSSAMDLSERIRRQYPRVKLYRSGKNLFYGAALNKGITLSTGDFVLCLNDDVVLDKDFIREGLKGFLLSAKIGLVSGKILRSSGKILDSTGLFLTPWRTARERGYGKRDSGQFEQEGFIFGVSGAAAFYRRQMLESVREQEDYFDSRFGMFYEDLDISWRARRLGWQAYYLPGALAYHVRGGSFRPDSGIGRPLARRYLSDQLHGDLICNRYLTILKNETVLGFLLHLVPLLVYDLCAWGYVLFFRPKVLAVSLRRIFTASARKKRF